MLKTLCNRGERLHSQRQDPRNRNIPLKFALQKKIAAVVVEHTYKHSPLLEEYMRPCNMACATRARPHTVQHAARTLCTVNPTPALVAVLSTHSRFINSGGQYLSFYIKEPPVGVATFHVLTI